MGYVDYNNGIVSKNSQAQECPSIRYDIHTILDLEIYVLFEENLASWHY